MRLPLTFLISIFLLSACATDLGQFPPHCYHSALMACAVMESYGYPNRIAIQATGKPGIYHAQCEMFDGEKWRWVILDRAPVVELGKREHGETVEFWSKEQALGVTYNHALQQGRK